MRSGSGSDERASSGSDAESSDSEELAAIAPLPPQALPEFYTKEAAHARGEQPAEPPPLRRPPKAPPSEGEGKPRRKKPRSGEGVREDAAGEGAGAADGAPRPRCELCSLLFTSDAQLAEHLKARPAAHADTAGGPHALHAGITQGKKHALKERAQRLGPNAPPPAPGWRPKANPDLQARARVAHAWRNDAACNADMLPLSATGARVHAVPQAVHQRGAAGGAQAGQVAPNAPVR
jgi:hypothetical protein